MDTVRQQQDAFEATLASEGLAPISEAANGGVRPLEVAGGVGGGEAVSLYLEWASDVLAACPFRRRGMGLVSPAKRRKVWALVAEGRTWGSIAEELGLSRRHVRLAVAVTKEEAGIPAPVANPWARHARLRNQPTEDDDVMNRPVEYARVELRNELKVPGNPTTKNVLLPMKGHDGQVQRLMGIPHAGGIDFELPTHHQQRKTTTVITVPWWNIKHAERAPEDWIP